ncbi:cupin domain-containing protein [Chitinispirillales bacterium ANBcel5]|uniref:cupin domain-containing protein n=1 Tax=Cellulosispirillum alkaliphilum TaxID=3039283 RepID=UPI002A4EAFFD|nr:cupin domain-containing protein [Chitinispirillales bacterium ANBcel5]
MSGKRKVSALFTVFASAAIISLLVFYAHSKPENGYDPRTTYGPEEHIIYTSDEIQWQDGPPSLPEGAEYAVLEGDLSDTGLFVVRLRFPDGYIIPPHTHPSFERITVLSGTFNLGYGETVDNDNTQRLDAGGFTTLMPDNPHFAIIEGETVVQQTSIGPSEIHYINPEDDPRN